MKKKILILIPILFIICFSSTTEALTTGESTGVDGLELFSYPQRFSDYSGALLVTTTAVNNSGIMEAYISTTVICMNESRNFRLRVYDSDNKAFIDTNDEDGIGQKERRFRVRTHIDTESLLWTVYVTDMSAEIFYAQISLYYTYDEDYEYNGPDNKEEEESISQEELEKQVKIASRNTSLSYLAVTSLTIVLTAAVVIQRKGTGVKAFIKSKIKGEGD